MLPHNNHDFAQQSNCPGAPTSNFLPMFRPVHSTLTSLTSRAYVFVHTEILVSCGDGVRKREQSRTPSLNQYEDPQPTIGGNTETPSQTKQTLQRDRAANLDRHLLRAIAKTPNPNVHGAVWLIPSRSLQPLDFETHLKGKMKESPKGHT